jgi:hypothetical protein
VDVYPNQYDLPHGWRPVINGAADPVVAELQREVGQGHVLHGLVAVPFARRNDHDQVLFRVYEAPAPLYIVHLTWRDFSQPDRPVADPYDTFIAFVEAAGND